MSLLQPFVTFVMIVLLGYVVHGFIVRQRKYNEYGNSCRTIYRPEPVVEDKHLFEVEDPWMHTFDTPQMNKDPHVHDNFEKIMSNMYQEDNSAIGKYNIR